MFHYIAEQNILTNGKKQTVRVSGDTKMQALTNLEKTIAEKYEPCYRLTHPKLHREFLAIKA